MQLKLPMLDVGETSEEHSKRFGRNSDLMMTSDEMAKQIGISRRSIENNIKKLKEMGLLMRHGSKKNGYWEVVK